MVMLWLPNIILEHAQVVAQECLNSKTCLKRPLKKTKIAPRMHSVILSTFIKVPFVFKTFDLSIFEWPLKTGCTVL